MKFYANSNKIFITLLSWKKVFTMKLFNTISQHFCHISLLELLNVESHIFLLLQLITIDGANSDFIEISIYYIYFSTVNEKYDSLRQFTP